MTDASHGMGWVGRGILFSGIAVIAAGVLLGQNRHVAGSTVWPFGLVMSGILIASFGFFWLLALKRQREWSPRDDLGPQPPRPPPGQRL